MLTDRPGKLTNDFFVNLLAAGTEWNVVARARTRSTRVGTRRAATVKWTASSADLVFGSNSVLRSLAEVYAADDANELFVRDFVEAWVKVMNLDRFDLA